MTITVMNPEAAEEIDKAMTRLAEATVAYMTRLNDIADIGTLTAGAHGYDYAVTVEQSEMLRVLPLLSDLTMSIEDEFGVKITTLAVAGTASVRKAKTA
jgi:hypothetical protein